MQRGELIGSGRSADAYAIDDEWVLRRYRDGGDATAEAVVMSHLAEHGYPVPRVRDATDTDLVIQRLYGPSMLQALEGGTITAKEAGAVLGHLLHRLHTIPARVSPQNPLARVLHLDLHPDNVMLTPDGPMVIDWRNTEEGPPGLDWGMSSLILAQAAVDTPAQAAVACAVLSSLLSHPGPSVTLGNANAGHLAEARTRRAADPAMSGREPRLLDDAVALVCELAPAAS
ncbi:phosphotransferase [Streptomyces sp. NPDC052236]|uniref:phosphotransferase n=1 Tax=Streptomyces sp. NPDC052236 TaxID=3365686 RepID=UPI0037D8C59A